MDEQIMIIITVFVMGMLWAFSGEWDDGEGDK